MAGKRKYNRFCNLSNGETIVELTQGQWMQIDTVDWETWDLCGYHAQKDDNTFYACGYPYGKIKGIKKLHRLIMGVDDPNIKIDHINGNGLDNRRSNLRTCTNGENLLNRNKDYTNTSGYKGVFWNKKCNKWQAQIAYNKKQIYLGLFIDKEKAAIAYDDAALKYHGEFVKTNFSHE